MDNQVERALERHCSHGFHIFWKVKDKYVISPSQGSLFPLTQCIIEIATNNESTVAMIAAAAVVKFEVDTTDAPERWLMESCPDVLSRD